MRSTGRSGPTGLGGTSNRSDIVKDKVVLSVPTEEGRMGGPFGRADFRAETVNLPKTEAQRILHHDEDDRLAPDEIYVIVPERWTIGGVLSPTNAKMKVPKIDNEYLMPPKLQKEYTTYLLKKAEAEKLKRCAIADKARMLGIMKMAYPTGVIGIENVSTEFGTPAPNVYAARTDSAAQQFERARAAREARMQQIVANSDTLQRRGFSFIQQTGDAPPQRTLAARKAQGLPQDNDTHSRLFARDEWKHNPARAAQLRQQDVRGRGYDLITGTAK
jgi:hypothetical protein